MNTEPRQQDLGLRETSPITRVEEYEFEPIQGYPMLRWKGKRSFTSTQYYPAQHKEIHGSEVDGWRNKIYWGDNLQVMSHLLKQFRGKIQLIYIDPPFDSKADYKKIIQVKGSSTTSDLSIFEEKQYTDIWTSDEYLQYMYERIILMRELLSDNGSLYLHCDYRRSHHLRCILDEVFGGHIANEIVWCYTRPSRVTDYFPRVHDTLLFYSKTKTRIFNTENIRIPYDQETLARSNRGAGQESVMGTVQGIERLREGGKIPEDHWWDIPHEVENAWKIPMLQGNALEREDYPTQKPEKLLTRIIETSSNVGDIVFDCFMGSGTTQAVAVKNGRRFLGVDINLGAIQTTTKRLLSIASELSSKTPTLGLVQGEIDTFYTGFEVYNVNNYDIFRNPVEAKALLIQALEINPLPAGCLFDGEKDGRMVKIMPINRIATRQDLNELITGFDYKTFQRRQEEHPNQPVEKVTLVCMGHEPDLAAHLKHQMSPFKLDIEVVDILRDKQDLHFKRDSEARVVIKDGYLLVEQFYPLNLMNKLSETKEDVEEWRQLVDSIMIDWNYDGAVLQPAIIDVPEGNALVSGRYRVPDDAGTVRVKITDLLSEPLEVEIAHG